MKTPHKPETKRLPRQAARQEVTLAYAGKLSHRRILATVRPVLLAIERECGRTRSGADDNQGTWQNRLIHADNLAALAALGSDRSVAGKVTLAYLDPPFASDQEYRSGARRTSTVSASRRDQLAYQDRLRSAAYLEFLRQRVLLLRLLLGEYGSIYVQIGPQMAHYVRALLDEVFGPEHFLNEIARVKCNPKNFHRRAYGNVKDTILFYSKAGRHVWNESRESMSEEEIRRLFPRVDAKGCHYTTTPLHAPGETRAGPTGAAWKGLRPPRGRHWRVDPAELTRLDRRGDIEWSRSGNPRKKIYADQGVRDGKKRQDIWTFKDPPYPVYPTEKNLAMLETIVLSSSNPGDLVLDCFAGSGTTLVAAERLGRRWIGVDSSAVAIEKARQRLLAVEGCSAFAVLRAAPR